MIIQPRSDNAISIILANGDRFDIHSPNEKEIVVSRPQGDKRNYDVAFASDVDGSWVHQSAWWMIRLSKKGEQK